MDASLVQDTNVFESLGSERTDTAARLLLQGAWNHRLYGTLRTAVHYRGALETYRRFSKEDRSVNEWVVQGEIPVGTWGAVGLDLRGRFKSFFHGPRGYSSFRGSPSFRWRISSEWNGMVFLESSVLNYAEGDFFDCRSGVAGLRFEWVPTARVVFAFQGTKGDARYDRPAYRFSAGPSGGTSWTAAGQWQHDTFYEWSLQIESTAWVLVRAGFGYETNASNNYGYAFRRPKAQVLAVKGIGVDWTVGLFWTWQIRRYSDPLAPFLAIRPESENEENNCVLVDVSRAITRRTSVKLQAGVYRNESPFRDLYYRKTLYAAGVTHAF